MFLLHSFLLVSSGDYRLGRYLRNVVRIGWVASWLPKIRSEPPDIAPLCGGAVHSNGVRFFCSQTIMDAKWVWHYIGGSLYTHIFYGIFMASRTKFYSLSYKYLSVILIKLKAEANSLTTIILILYFFLVALQSNEGHDLLIHGFF